MAQVTTLPEPQSAAEYDDRTTAAVKSVLIEIGQILGGFKGKFAIIGDDGGSDRCRGRFPDAARRGHRQERSASDPRLRRSTGG